MGQYLPIVVLTGLAIIFGALSSVASLLLAPRRPNTAKSAPYECGIVPSKEAPERFPVSFYVIAMLFIIRLWSFEKIRPFLDHVPNKCGALLHKAANTT